MDQESWLITVHRSKIRLLNVVKETLAHYGRQQATLDNPKKSLLTGISIFIPATIGGLNKGSCKINKAKVLSGIRQDFGMISCPICRPPQQLLKCSNRTVERIGSQSSSCGLKYSLVSFSFPPNYKTEMCEQGGMLIQIQLNLGETNLEFYLILENEGYLGQIQEH